MKTLHFASILVLAAATTFACDDDEDRLPAGSSGAAGKSGAAGRSGAAGDASAGQFTGTGGSDGGFAQDGGAAGAHFGGGGAAGESQGGGGGASDEDQGDGGGGYDAGGAGAGGPTYTEGGAGGDGGASNSGALEIIGNWDDNFGFSYVITSTEWNSSSIIEYDNALNVVYTQYPADDAFSPNKFAKNVYTQPQDDSFYQCTIVYSADTLDAAKASTAIADVSKLEDKGCAGFNWSKFTRQQ